MTANKFIDSSVWLEYFHNANFKEIIESKEILFTSILSLFEIKKKLLLSKEEESKINSAINFIKNHSIIIPLTEEIIENAVKYSINNELPAIDSLIYSSSQNQNSLLYSLDNDFRGLKDVILLDK